MDSETRNTVQVGDRLEAVFLGWGKRPDVTVVHVIDGKYDRAVIGRTDGGVYIRWDGPFPTWQIKARSLQEAWDKAYPQQAPRTCLQCGKTFRPSWHGPGSAVHCQECNPPRKPAHQATDRCHYCGQPASSIGFFGEMVCPECI